MLIKNQFHEGIRNGSITVTFRNWKTSRVKVGRQYRFGLNDLLEVDSLDLIAVSSIIEKEAINAGFAGVSELVAFLNKNSTAKVTDKSKVYRIGFFYIKDKKYSIPAENIESTTQSIEEVIAKLQKMDRLSKHGAWTKKALTLIQKNPRTAASQLAKILQRETQPLKADIRKLKKLGLTIPFETGYELSAFGKAVLKKYEEDVK